MYIPIKIKKLSESAVIPQKGTPGAIAYDLYTPRDYEVKPGRQILPLGLALEIPYGYEAKVEPRSGCSSQGMPGKCNGYDIRANADVITGKIDSDYRGEIGIILINRDPTSFIIPAHTRVAQLTFYHSPDTHFIETDTLSETMRGEGGFGHTGTK